MSLASRARVASGQATERPAWKLLGLLLPMCALCDGVWPGQRAEEGTNQSERRGSYDEDGLSYTH